uniref:C2 domain-containing protein n=1 Tax=Oryza rufipogon TaxID=4529 RepID=A0A0E0Q380_ORYRU
MGLVHALLPLAGAALLLLATPPPATADDPGLAVYWGRHKEEGSLREACDTGRYNTGGGYSLPTNASAADVADNLIWNAYLGGHRAVVHRPFGDDAAVDGIDFFIDQGGADHYDDLARLLNGYNKYYDDLALQVRSDSPSLPQSAAASAASRPLEEQHLFHSSNPSTSKSIILDLRARMRSSSTSSLQKVKTSVKKKSVNPIWHEELTLSIMNPIAPIKLGVFDKDTFSRDDPMGDAEIDLEPFMEVLNMDPENIRNGSIIKTIRPSNQNCLADESHLFWRNGKFVQDIILRLRNVESGELQVQLQWVKIPGRH